MERCEEEGLHCVFCSDSNEKTNVEFVENLVLEPMAVTPDKIDIPENIVIQSNHSLTNFNEEIHSNITYNLDVAVQVLKQAALKLKPEGQFWDNILPWLDGLSAPISFIVLCSVVTLFLYIRVKAKIGNQDREGYIPMDDLRIADDVGEDELYNAQTHALRYYTPRTLNYLLCPFCGVRFSERDRRQLFISHIFDQHVQNLLQGGAPAAVKDTTASV